MPTTILDDETYPEALHRRYAEEAKTDSDHIATADKMVCNWQQPSYDHFEANYWDTDCGESWAITEGTPTENGMKFCHGCGKPIKEHPFADSEDE